MSDSNAEFECPRILDPTQTDVTDTESVADKHDRDFPKLKPWEDETRPETDEGHL